MSEREQIRQIIDTLPEYKLSRLLIFLRGMQLDDEIEDDLYCENLVASYLADNDPEKHDTVSLAMLAEQEEIVL